MRIAIGNQKGGVGKTTLSILLANYIKEELKEDIIVLDLDPQKSFFERAEEEKELIENEDLIYTVLDGGGNLNSAFELLSVMEEDGNVLVDLPGFMFTNENIDVLDNIDVLIIPFDYSKLCIESTLTYVYVIQELAPELRVLFLPNRIKSNAKFELKNQINSLFSEIGFVLPEIKDSVQFSRITCFQTPVMLKEYLLYKFADIFNNHEKEEGNSN